MLLLGEAKASPLTTTRSADSAGRAERKTSSLRGGDHGVALGLKGVANGLAGVAKVSGLRQCDTCRIDATIIAKER